MDTWIFGIPIDHEGIDYFLPPPSYILLDIYVLPWKIDSHTHGGSSMYKVRDRYQSTPNKSITTIYSHWWINYLELHVVGQERILGSTSTHRGLDVGKSSGHLGETNEHGVDPSVGGI